MSQVAEKKLTPAQLAFYHQNGYVIVEDVLDRSELSSLNEELHQLWLARKAAGIFRDEDTNNIHGLGASSGRSHDLARDPRLLSLIEEIVFPGISLSRPR